MRRSLVVQSKHSFVKTANDSDSVSKFKHYKLRLLKLLAKAPPRSLQVCIDAVAKLPPFFCGSN
jgi:hypothetical protein